LATYSYINYLEFFYTEDLSISFSFIWSLATLVRMHGYSL
jgi:hypothetical protein